MRRRFAVSIDVGGTFTDFALFDLASGSIAALHKVLTDARRPARAVVEGWTELLAQVDARPEEVDYAVHGTTLVTNAIVERRGAKTALITTRGFRDVLEIGIEQLYDIYDLFAPYPEPLIPRHLRREVGERVTRDGAVVEPLDDAEVRALADDLAREGVEAVAVSLLHAYRNPTHERRIAAILAERHPDIAVSLSSSVAPLIGEYERTSTVAADAYVKPLLRRYLGDLLDALRARGFARPLYMVLSSGGITSAEAAMAYPIRLLESGPAAGAFAASYFGRLAGHADVLSLDMGGTTAKACVVERGQPEVAHMLEADRVHRFKPGSGLPIMAPTVDLIEIGAGGGSIAHLSEVGLLSVGPQSAESDPGPACYGLGGEEPTVTDANVVLGYLDPDYFLGGRMRLDPERARRAIEARVAAPLRLSVAEAAWGIHAIVNENMARAARTHIIERNRDPRGLALVAFGGAGPAHAVAVARILGISTVVIPPGAGVASAIGALTAPMALPLVRSRMTLLDACDWEAVRALYSEMETEALQALGAGETTDVRFSRAADMRFAGQYHELRVELPGGPLGPELAPRIAADFQARYREVYGRLPQGLPIEVLNWHLTATVPRPGIALAAEPSRAADVAAARKGEREVFFADPAPAPHPCPVYDRYRLQPGVTFEGPAIVEEREATVVVPPGCAVAVDGYRNLIVRVGKVGAA